MEGLPLRISNAPRGPWTGSLLMSALFRGLICERSTAVSVSSGAVSTPHLWQITKRERTPWHCLSKCLAVKIWVMMETTQEVTNQYEQREAQALCHADANSVVSGRKGVHVTWTISLSQIFIHPKDMACEGLKKRTLSLSWRNGYLSHCWHSTSM